MKRVLLLSILLFLSTILINCKDAAVEANFNFDKDKVEAPASIKFTNLSGSADNYQWSFGDGTISNESNPSHEYLHGGIYTVCLKSFKNGNECEKSKTIEIYRPIQIYPGNKVLSIELGEAWLTVKNKFSSSNNIEAPFVNIEGKFYHTIFDSSNNYCVKLVGTDSTLNDNDFVCEIVMYYKFEGTTFERIGIDDEISKATSIFGIPDKQNTKFSDIKSLDYDNLGISFGFKEGSLKIATIMIYPKTQIK